MLSRRAVRYLSSLGFLSVVGFFAVGCTLDEYPALQQIGQARDAISKAETEGAKERFPGEFAELEKRYLNVRGVFYACNEEEASSLAQQLIADAEALANKRMEPEPMRPNEPPIADLAGPATGVANQLLSFSGAGSSDPDGTITSYKWDYGDGTTANFTFPRATHRYENPGTYRVELIVEDDKGATGVASREVKISEMQVISIAAEVLFDTDKADLRPEGIAELEPLLHAMRSDRQLRATIRGYTDSRGTEAYNLRLSKRRAESVAAFLTKGEGGVGSDRLRLEWFGEADPRDTNATPEGRQLNRRVEITVSASGI